MLNIYCTDTKLGSSWKTKLDYSLRLTLDTRWITASMTT